MRIVKCRAGQYEAMVASVPGFVYVGRAFAGYPASVLGNPFRVGRDGTLAEVIGAYRAWLWLMFNVDRRAGKEVPEQVREEAWGVVQLIAEMPEDTVLGCWCVNDEYPHLCERGKEVCHAQIIAKAARWLDWA